MNRRALLRPAIFLAIAIGLCLAAELLWSVGMDIRETALNPACRLLHGRAQMGLGCDLQNKFGFFLVIIAPFLGFGALMAIVHGVVATVRIIKHRPEAARSYGS